MSDYLVHAAAMLVALMVPAAVALALQHRSVGAATRPDGETQPERRKARSA